MRLVRLAGAASVAVALGLTGAKAWAWAQTGSLSVAASLADSALDVAASGGNFAAILYAQRPPDDDHRFGHAAAEDLATLGQSLLIAASGVYIGLQATRRLMEPAAPSAAGEGMAVMVMAILVTGALALFQRWVARRTGSSVVAADSLHYVSDIIPNVGAILALASAHWGGPLWLDPAVALLAAGMMLHGAWGLGGEAFHGLMDRELPPEEVARVAAEAEAEPGVRGWHDLKTRRAGGRRFVQIHIELDGVQSLEEAHERARRIKARLVAMWPDADVIIHMDPYRPEGAPGVMFPMAQSEPKG